MLRKCFQDEYRDLLKTGPDKNLVATAKSLCDPVNKSWCDLCHTTFIKQDGEGLPSPSEEITLELFQE